MENRSDISKNFVPYELAVKLKELGFDEPCFCTYHNGELSRNPSNKIDSKPIQKEPYTWKNSRVHNTVISAPLWSQVFDWFREKYKFKIGIGVNDKGLYYDYKIVLFNSTETYYKDCYNTHTEARLACLEKLIELCKKIT